jgi:2-polyprenyl-3-methyl-5-hydroxy-6-metoxy-1,4-benzoquinol methylase
MNEKNNIDKKEIEKFDDLAESWWDPEGDFKPLHQINPLRMEFILKKLL